MSDKSLKREPGEVIYHFDVERSSIPLAQFVDTARATQEIIDSFNRLLFDENLKYELHIKTPEHGSILEIIGVTVAIGAPVLAFLGTDIGKAFFKGLTSKEPADWAETAGASIRQRFSKLKPLPASAEVVRAAESPIEVSEVSETEIANLTAAEAIALILTRFLELDIDNLRPIGVTPAKFREAFQGRNRIFKGCIDNSEVQGITFDREASFPIKRKDFPRKIAQIPDVPPEETVKPSELSFETVDIIVNSPNWKRDGRNWQAAIGKYQDISFSIEDEAFWLRVERRDPDIKPTIRDNMRVQWAYPAGAARPTHVKVYRVLSYNGRQLSPPMSDMEIQALQTTVNLVKPDMPELFDERSGSHKKNDKGSA